MIRPGRMTNPGSTNFHAQLVNKVCPLELKIFGRRTLRSQHRGHVYEKLIIPDVIGSSFFSEYCDRWEIKNFAVANKFQELCQDSKKTELLINNSRGGFCARGVFFVFAMKMAVIKNDKSLHG